MQILNQNTKKIMEGCKERAKDAGLSFDQQTLEYIVTNKNLLTLSPKNMIPNLYDYWVHDVQVLKERRIYEIYPNNPFETVINTRPAISFYNDNNPDWLNVMIFYHVLAHIDFFQNNIFFRNTWDDDFNGIAEADATRIEELRREMGAQKRWVDYVIEFTRGIDNLVGFFPEMNTNSEIANSFTARVDFFFGSFLRDKDISQKKLNEELEEYNTYVEKHGEKSGENMFFESERFCSKYPEFVDIFEKYQKEKKGKKRANDILQFIMQNSEYINDPSGKNKWIKEVMQIVRNTSLYFQPQIRGKIMNEGWASYWHQKLFLTDDRISGHEIDYAIINSSVMSMPRVGLNPYGLGCAIFEYIYEMARKGKLGYEFSTLRGIEDRKKYDKDCGDDFAMKTLFDIRRELSDSLFVNLLSEVDFQDFVTKNKLFVADRKLNMEKRVWTYFIKSKKGEDYREQVIRSLYHPPSISIDEVNAEEGTLYLSHKYEGRSLHTPHIPAVLRGIEFLWRGPVRKGTKLKAKGVFLETTEFIAPENKKNDFSAQMMGIFGPPLAKEPEKFKTVRALYYMNKGVLNRNILDDSIVEVKNE